jgi:hypothetical protein
MLKCLKNVGITIIFNCNLETYWHFFQCFIFLHSKHIQFSIPLFSIHVCLSLSLFVCFLRFCIFSYSFILNRAWNAFCHVLITPNPQQQWSHQPPQATTLCLHTLACPQKHLVPQTAHQKTRWINRNRKTFFPTSVFYFCFILQFSQVDLVMF